MAFNNTAGEGKLRPRKVGLGDHARGLIVLVGGALILMGMALGLMVVLTSPDGWATEAVNSAMSDEGGGLIAVSFANAD